jgi:hypothetical protein
MRLRRSSGIPEEGLRGSKGSKGFKGLKGWVALGFILYHEAFLYSSA